MSNDQKPTGTNPIKETKPTDTSDKLGDKAEKGGKAVDDGEKMRVTHPADGVAKVNH